MTTSKLIETARNFSKPDVVFDRDDVKIKAYAVLVNKLCDRLEMAYEDLAWMRACHTCKYATEPLPNTGCTNCTFTSKQRQTQWQWRGDADDNT